MGIRSIPSHFIFKVFAFLRSIWGWLLLLLLIGLTALFAPLERTLGANIRLIYVHGSWVWTGQILFALAAIAGLAGLLNRQPRWHESSLALGRAGLFFWLTYLPMSLLVMQMNWGGLYLDEPRWRLPLAFGVAGVLLQIALVLIQHPLITSAANLGFGTALWVVLRNTPNVLHPDSPVTDSNSANIQFYFGFLLCLTLLWGVQLAAAWYRRPLPFWQKTQER